MDILIVSIYHKHHNLLYPTTCIRFHISFLLASTGLPDRILVFHYVFILVPLTAFANHE